MCLVQILLTKMLILVFEGTKSILKLAHLRFDFRSLYHVCLMSSSVRLNNENRAKRFILMEFQMSAIQRYIYIYKYIDF